MAINSSGMAVFMKTRKGSLLISLFLTTKLFHNLVVPMKNFFRLLFLLPIAVVLGLILMGDPTFDEVRVEEWVEEIPSLG